MDAVFQLDEGARLNFIQIMMQSLGSAYACLWSFSTPSSCLFFSDGLCGEEGSVQSNALFDQYKKSLFVILPAELHARSHGRVPGLAFRNNTPFIEVRGDQLLTLVSNSIQRQFYQAARIKTAIFMGCRSGEMELGFSDEPPVDMEMQMMSVFPEDFSRHLPIRELPIPAVENPNPPPPSSSSSLLRSPSMDSHSPEYCSLLFNLTATAATAAAAVSSSSQPLLLTRPSTTTPTTAVVFPELLARFLTAESEHAAMTSAFLAVMTSPSLSSTLHQLQQNPQQQQQQPPPENPRPSAFARYTTARFKPGSFHGHNMLQRSIAYCRSMNLIRLRERLQGAAAGGGSGGRLISRTQLHHMMYERKRREKLNESYRSLKTLLPPGTKNYKAAVLDATREFLTSLRSQVEDLRWRNAILEAQGLPPPSKEASPAAADESVARSSRDEESTSRPVEVRVRTVSDSASTSSQDRTVDLRVVLRGDVSMLILVIRILEFLKQVRNVNILSIEADARIRQQDVVENHLYLRLHVEGEEWEEDAFREAVRRLVDDFAQ